MGMEIKYEIIYTKNNQQPVSATTVSSFIYDSSGGTGIKKNKMF